MNKYLTKEEAIDLLEKAIYTIMAKKHAVHRGHASEAVELFKDLVNRCREMPRSSTVRCADLSCTCCHCNSLRK